MGTREGNIKNVGKKALLTEFIKASFAYDLMFFTFISSFVFFYLKMTPFSDGIIGFLCFILMVVVSFLVFITLDTAGRECNWAISSTYNHFRNLGDLHRAHKINTSFILIFFLVVWFWAVIYAPNNAYNTEFKPNAISWLNQGQCDEVKKYDPRAFDVCKRMIKVRNMTNGTFTITSKPINIWTTECLYNLSSEKGEISISDRVCNLSLGQKVSVKVEAYLLGEQVYNVYDYSLSFKPL